MAAAYLQEIFERGFCVLRNVVPAARLAQVAAAYDRAFAEGTPPDLHQGRSGGNVRLADLVNRGPEFDELYVLEPVLAACELVIGRNGATRFVPGTHTAAGEDSAHAGKTRPEGGAEIACGPPGSVIVYHASTWHGYSSNDSAAPRRSIQGAYGPRGGTAAFDWVRRMQPATAQRLSARARQVLGLQ